MTSRSLGHRAPLLWIVLPVHRWIGARKTNRLPRRGVAVARSARGRDRGNCSPARACVGGASRPIAAMTLAGVGSYALHRARLSTWDPLPSREARVSLKVTRVFMSKDPKRAAGLAIVTRVGRAPRRPDRAKRIFLARVAQRREPAAPQCGLVRGGRAGHAARRSARQLVRQLSCWRRHKLPPHARLACSR